MSGLSHGRRAHPQARCDDCRRPLRTPDPHMRIRKKRTCRSGSRMKCALPASQPVGISTGMLEDPKFWAAGISLVAHMQNPHCPAVHLNTRMFWTPHAWWFGGGSDLNPCIEYPEDTERFHKVLENYCAPHGVDLYPPAYNEEKTITNVIKNLKEW